MFAVLQVTCWCDNVYNVLYRVKQEDTKYKKKVNSTGGGPPPSPPKATEEFSIASSMMSVDLSMGEDAFETFEFTHKSEYVHTTKCLKLCWSWVINVL